MHDETSTGNPANAQQQPRLAQAASPAKTAFLPVTTHEARTPLNAVFASAEMLAREAHTPRQADLARRILSAGGMLRGRLNGILDFIRAKAGDASLGPADRPGEAPPEPANARRILGADDNASNREVLRLLLAPLGADLDLVVNGAEAVVAAGRGRYDAILMDACMPVMDGEAAVRAIRAEESRGDRRTLIIMLTADVFPDEVDRYLAAGADRVLAKPISVADLYACLAGPGQGPGARRPQAKAS